MKKNNKLEIIGFAILVIGALSFLSENFYNIESLAAIYSYGEILLPLGLGVWALGRWQKEKAEKDKAKNK